MTSTFAFLVGLLQAALSLLGFVQAHPELPPASRALAQQVAQQAVTQATQALATSAAPAPSVSPKTFGASPAQGPAPLHVTFSYPFTQDRDAPVIVFGDATSQEHMDCPRDGCTLSHVYQTPGVYTAMLEKYPASCTLEPWQLCGDSPQVQVFESATITVSE